MKYSTAKISLFILIATLISACNALKKVPSKRYLLTKNEVVVNNKKTKEENVTNQLAQKPNTTLLGYRFRLNLYNLAKDNTDSIFYSKYAKNPKKYIRKSKFLSKKQVDRLRTSFWYSGIHSFLKNTGEPPVIFNESMARKSVNKLKNYYFNQGYFSVKANYQVIQNKNRKVSVKYTVNTGKPTFLDTISTNIDSPELDSIYKTIKHKSFLKQGNQYKEDNIDAERTRITNYFRNHGAYYFQQQSIYFEIDTTTQKAPLTINISNQIFRKGDATKTKPYNIYKIGNVNIFTTDQENKNEIIDSTQYKNFNLYSKGKLRYRPKAITDGIFIQKDSLFSEENRSLTQRSLSNLRTFDYPTVKFVEDTVKKTLNTNIYLASKPKFTFKPNLDITHSNIQDVGVSGNLSFSSRNVFRGAEILELGLRGNIGSSKQLANPDNRFFNLSEIGADLRLSFPRIFFLFKTERIIPKYMFPYSVISSGFTRQKNIGLDKENFTAVINYNWTPSKKIFAKFDLVNLQYVKNINVLNYFNVYGSSYNRLNNIARAYKIIDSNSNLTTTEGGADDFITNVLNGKYPAISPDNDDYKSVKSIKERKDRLTENNLIFSSNFTYSKDTKENLLDNEFFNIKGKVEIAGNLFSLIAGLSNQPTNTDGSRNLFGLQYSQYAKAELDYIKHWDLHGGTVAAFRSFLGVAIPYGNSKSIPFSRSYFAGGSNDNRAWQSYSLGPGSSGGLNDFNEANMKIAFSLELRARLLGDLNGAIFADLGNIWNIKDSETDQTKIFSGIKSLQSLALGTGFGLRYDFKFFIARLDYGFKTYNPSTVEGDGKNTTVRGTKDFNWDKSVLNIGINYPF